MACMAATERLRRVPDGSCKRCSTAAMVACKPEQALHHDCASPAHCNRPTHFWLHMLLPRTWYQFCRWDSQLKACRMISYPSPAAGPELVAPPCWNLQDHHSSINLGPQLFSAKVKEATSNLCNIRGRKVMTWSSLPLLAHLMLAKPQHNSVAHIHARLAPGTGP